MIISHDVGIAMIYLGLIMFSPFLAVLSWNLSRYILDVYVADEVVIVTFLENGRPTSKIKISAMRKGNIVQQIKAQKDIVHE
ncbi:hypothetical protein V2K57_13270 [Pseudomonas alliivorans]|nr:hypothetical protein [Pseudomonas alliivorans]MEE4701815.1 hypothetical protein [Pseudomonas alliivorans]MEE4737341.1 hypothetical protein [Pseudomonas alliivorans]